MSDPLALPTSRSTRLPSPEPSDIAASATAEPAQGVIAGIERLGPGTLPSPLTPFVGRARELAALGRLLAGEDVRLVTLSGPGGVGKTRLALETARTMGTVFADGVVYVPLAAVQDPTLIPAAVMQALGLVESDSLPPAARLATTLRERRVLLVLDNLEHLAGELAATWLADLLRACPSVTALVTSRTLLHLSGENAFIVPPLALPDGRGSAPPSSLTIEALGAVESIQLFVSRARAAWPEFALTTTNATTVAAICQRVDGLPLAIELAASRSAVLSPAELLHRLERRLPLLTGGPQDQPQRLRTMRNAIAWSYDLLDPSTQARFRRLAVFAGGFGLAAAEAVTDNERTDAPLDGGISFLDSMASLVTSSLLQRYEQPDGETRFAVLETVREFALDQLQRAGEEEVARAAHAAFYLAFMERADVELWARTNSALLDRIEVEHDNLRAAMTWAIAHEPLTALRMTNGLAAFWSKRCHWTEGRAWIRRALDTGAGEGTAARAAALGRIGALAGDQGDFDEARRDLMESLRLAELLGETQLAARAFRALGIQASNQSDFDDAGTLFERALDLFRSLRDQAGIARCLNDLGLVANRRGDQNRAIAYQEESLPIARAVGDDWQVCIVLGNLGAAYYDRGDYARGEALTQEALALARQLGDTFGVAVNLYNLGNCVFQLGDVGGALVRFRESLALSVELGERHLASRTLDRLGVALHQAGASRAGARLIGAAAAIREADGDSLFVEEDADLAMRFQQMRDDLGAATYTAAWESGRSLPFAQAAAEATAQADAALLAYRAAPAQARAGLTVREAEVLQLLTDGLSDKEIGEKLYISGRTASSHVATIMAKLGVDSRTAAVATAFRRGLV